MSEEFLGGWDGHPGYRRGEWVRASPAFSSQAQWKVLAQTWAAGVGTPGSPLPPRRQNRSQSQTDARVPAEEEAALSGLAAVAAAPAGTELMMTGGLNLLAPEAEGRAPGAAGDPSLGAVL